MTNGDFDFFGAPSTPWPTGPVTPAPDGQAGPPQTVNQFGTPVVNQFGLPPTAPVPPLPLTPVPSSGSGRQLAILAGIVAVIVLAVGGFVWLQGQGKKSATKVADTIEAPIVKAHQTEAIVDLQQAVQAEETYLADHDTYAASVTDLTGFVPSPTSRVTVVSATATAYCLRADDLSTLHAPSMYESSASSVASTTPCS